MWIILIIILVIVVLFVLPLINKAIDEPKDDAYREKIQLAYKWQKLIELRRDPNEHPANIWIRLDFPFYKQECREIVEQNPVEVIIDGINRDIGRLKEMGLSEQEIENKLNQIM